MLDVKGRLAAVLCDLRRVVMGYWSYCIYNSLRKVQWIWLDVSCVELILDHIIVLCWVGEEGGVQ